MSRTNRYHLPCLNTITSDSIIFQWFTFVALTLITAKFREGNVFPLVYHSVHGRGSAIPPGIRYPPWKEHGTRQEVTSYSPPRPRNHKSRQYASYWNVFLFIKMFLHKGRVENYTFIWHSNTGRIQRCFSHFKVSI